MQPGTSGQNSKNVKLPGKTVVESVQLNEYNKVSSVVWQNEEQDMKLLTTTETAKRWGISARRIALLCSQDRVKGAEKVGNTWLIPDDAEKPQDPRKKNPVKKNK